MATRRVVQRIRALCDRPLVRYARRETIAIIDVTYWTPAIVSFHRRTRFVSLYGSRSNRAARTRRLRVITHYVAVPRDVFGILASGLLGLKTKNFRSKFYLLKLLLLLYYQILCFEKD